MSDERTRALHDAHTDERNRVAIMRRHERDVERLRRHEQEVRDRERERVLAHVLAPTREDDTGFCPRGLI